MNLFKRELRANLLPFMLWSGITALLFLVTVVIYPHIINGQNISDLMTMFPEEVLKAFNFDLAGIATASGWLCSEGLVFYYLIGGIYASVLGANLVLKEENDQTIEFLYAKPLSKNQILISKMACGCLYIVGFAVVVTVGNLVGLAIIDDLELGKMLLCLMAPLLIFLSFFCMALLSATFLRHTKTATILSCASVFFAYFIQIVSVISEKVEFLKYFTVFSLADSRYLLQNLHLSLWGVLAFAFIVVSNTTLTFIAYRRKEYL